jgi:hypothetical protein
LVITGRCKRDLADAGRYDEALAIIDHDEAIVLIAFGIVKTASERSKSRDASREVTQLGSDVTQNGTEATKKTPWAA